MRQLHPEPIEDVDVVATYVADDRPAPDGRPWVMVNMISSADGAIAVDGVSGGLGGPADLEVFRAIRSLPDVIVVGAGTVRAENYQPVARPADAVAERRLDGGRSDRARLAIVTRSLRLDVDTPLFRESEPAPLVYTTHSAADAAPEHPAELVGVGDDTVGADAILTDLAAREVGLVLLEGGPTLNGDFLAADLIDEVCLSLSPVLVGGDGGRIIRGGLPSTPAPLGLERVLTADGLLFLRYVRQR